MSDPQAGECPPRSRWKSWRGRLLVGEISIGRIRHHAIRCRMNSGMPLADPRAAGRSPLPILQCRLSEVPHHVLRVECMRCFRIVEIQKADAVRFYGPHAVWKDVGQAIARPDLHKSKVKYVVDTTKCRVGQPGRRCGDKSWGFSLPQPFRVPRTPAICRAVGDEMAQKPKAVVNLDALIQRADLAAPGEAAEEFADISILDLDPKGFLYPALRKPDFQRETAGSAPEQVADLIATFARRDLIPAVILWRAGQNVFVIDGAHRLSALIAWVHDDYGDKDISRKFFQDDIPDEQIKAAERTRELVVASIGSYSDHRKAIEKPAEARPEIAERATRLGWQKIPAQWIENPDHEKAEKSSRM